MVGSVATSSKGAYAIHMFAAPRAPAPVAVLCWPIPPQETLRVLPQSLWGLWVLVRTSFVWALWELFKLDLEKAKEPEIKLPSVESSKKQESSRKTPTFPILTIPKPLTMWTTKNCRKFLERWESQTTWPTSWEICMQVRKQQLELDMEEQTGSK